MHIGCGGTTQDLLPEDVVPSSPMRVKMNSLMEDSIDPYGVSQSIEKQFEGEK
jgi:hypothetical protein